MRGCPRLIITRDLARVVDGEGLRGGAARGVEGGVAAAIVEEAVGHAGAVGVVPCNFARIVDGLGISSRAARDIEGGVADVVEGEAVGAAVVAVPPRDLARTVDS